MPNPKRHVVPVSHIALLGYDIYFREVLHVQHLNVKPRSNGLLDITGQYITGVEKAYQVFLHRSPAESGSVYIGVVFRLEGAYSEWCAVDSGGQFWSSFEPTRRGAIEYLMKRFFAHGK
jgi:hypothetical protein